MTVRYWSVIMKTSKTLAQFAMKAFCGEMLALCNGRTIDREHPLRSVERLTQANSATWKWLGLNDYKTSLLWSRAMTLVVSFDYMKEFMISRFFDVCKDARKHKELILLSIDFRMDKTTAVLAKNMRKAAASIAVTEGNLEIIKRLIDDGFVWSLVCYLRAIGNDNEQIAAKLAAQSEQSQKEFHTGDHGSKKFVLETAAKRGKVRVLRKFSASPAWKPMFDCDVLVRAAEGGHKPTFDFVWHHLQSMDVCQIDIAKVRDAAAQGGNVDILKFMLETYPELHPSEGACVLAISSGGMATFKVLDEEWNYPLNPEGAWYFAVSTGNTDALNHLLTRNSDECDRDVALKIAAHEGRMKVVEFCIQRMFKNKVPATVLCDACICACEAHRVEVFESLKDRLNKQPGADLTPDENAEEFLRGLAAGRLEQWLREDEHGVWMSNLRTLRNLQRQ